VDPNVVVTPVLNSVKNLLEVAAAEPSIKRFVYTSSSIAATYPNPHEKVLVDSSSWNHAAVDAAWKPPPYNQDRMWIVYAASKLQSEQACFDFVKEKKPGFVLNTVLPNYAMGEILDPRQRGSSGGLIRAAWEGQEVPIFASLPSQYMVGVKDVGRLHVAALVEPDVQNERLLAFSEPYTYNEVMSMLRKLGPDRNIPKDKDDESKDLSIIDTKRSIELLQRMGRPGFTGMEESIKENIGI
jgi:nucleoside-diphosphate-sugar epimerase